MFWNDLEFLAALKDVGMHPFIAANGISHPFHLDETHIFLTHSALNLRNQVSGALACEINMYSVIGMLTSAGCQCKLFQGILGTAGLGESPTFEVSWRPSEYL